MLLGPNSATTPSRLTSFVAERPLLSMAICVASITGGLALKKVGISSFSDRLTFVIMRTLANQRFAFAQKALGSLYLEGKGVPQSDHQAFHYFALAADQKDPDAEYMLAWMYSKGRGIAQSDLQAFRYCQLSALQGNSNAQSMLGSMYFNQKGTPSTFTVEQRDQQAQFWCRSAAVQGHLEAQAAMGFMYKNGLCGIAPNPAAAFRWFTRSAGNGYFMGQYGLACLYLENSGIPPCSSDAQRLRIALYWCRLSAAQNYSEAKELLPRIEGLLNPTTP